MNVTSGRDRGDVIAACVALAAALRTVGGPLAQIDEVIDSKLGFGTPVSPPDRPPSAAGFAEAGRLEASIAEGHHRLIHAVVGRAAGTHHA